MKVILLSDVRGSGKKGQVVKVSDGYAKNYLLPNKLAKEATNQSLEELKNKQNSVAYEKKCEEEESKRIAKIIEGKSITVFANAGEGGKLFGTVTSKDIANKINETFDVNISKKKIHLNGDIKSFGTYSFNIKIYHDISVKMNLVVTESSDK